MESAMIHPVDTLPRYGLAHTKPMSSFKQIAPLQDLHAHGFAFLGENHYIRSGYRVHYSTSDCIHSLFELHNETWNVWTHVVGSLAFATLLAMELVTGMGTLDGLYVERWPLCLYLGSVSVCFALSATYHLMYVQDAATASVYLRLDYAGILVLIFGGAVPMLHITFSCSPPLQTFYVGLASAVSCAAFVATFLPAFTTS
ncbi:hypothetical protein As57867_024994, partial [Aphanomyces stellatus]